MNNRWCIIAGPRSGSRWLEDSIWAYFFEITKSAQRLAEIIHPIMGNKYPPLLSPTNTLYLNEQYKDNGQHNDLTLFLKQQTDTILKGNSTQPLTMRVFCQPWHYSKEEYLDFFLKMKNHGFNFISLERNIADRAVSWYFMETTGIIHNADPINVIVEEEEKIIVDITRFLELYELCKIDHQARLSITSLLPVKKITYENLLQDCADLQIPIGANIAIKKTYNIPYKDKIQNWEELVNAIQLASIEKIYE
jgi:hypothetical protein